MRFAKWQGLGNDYLIIDAADLPAPLSPKAIGLLCDRHLGVGGDGILLLEQPTGALPGAVARMRVLNPDGSEPEMCGNGIRMFARYLAGRGLVEGEEFVVETLAGPIVPRLLPGGQVRVAMGTARFVSDGIALEHLAAAGGDGVVARQLDLPTDSRVPSDLRRPIFTFVDVGNPHCVIPVADLQDLPLEVVGPLIERLPLFPRRVNVEFIVPQEDGSVSMRVWERGVGETQACGTGATAVGAAAVRLELAESPVLVHLLGGDLEIEVGDDWAVTMTGPAEETFQGELSAALADRIADDR